MKLKELSLDEAIRQLMINTKAKAGLLNIKPTKILCKGYEFKTYGKNSFEKL